jgi:hypothetical protein
LVPLELAVTDVEQSTLHPTNIGSHTKPELQLHVLFVVVLMAVLLFGTPRQLSVVQLPLIHVYPEGQVHRLELLESIVLVVQFVADKS